MNKEPWRFADPTNTAVLTTKQVVEQGALITTVTHDADGEWQFLCGTTDDPADALVVGLGSMVARYPSLNALADMPLGWIAWRGSPAEAWQAARNVG